MPAQEQVRITFLRISPKKSLAKLGTGRFRFHGSVAGQSFGHTGGNSVGAKAFLDTRQGLPQLDLQAAGWTFTFPSLRDLQELVVTVQGVDDEAARIKAGSTTHQFAPLDNLPPAFKFHGRQGTYSDDSAHFSVSYMIEPEISGVFDANHPTRAILSAVRGANGTSDFTTLSGRVLTSRIEICPVRPVPPNPILRPVIPGGLGGAVQTTNGVNVQANDPVNSIKNPIFIPIMPLSQATFLTAACIEQTYYFPANLQLEDDDPRLTWEANPAGHVRFLKARTNGLVGETTGVGGKIYVYGEGGPADAEVTLTLKLEGEPMATFRALVGTMKNLPCRFNIMAHPRDANFVPSSTPDLISRQIKLANIFFRQVGLQLQLDANAAFNPENIAHHPRTEATTVPGIFRVNVPTNETRNIDAGSFHGFRYNYRQNVLNFIYVVSSDGSLGAATAWPKHPLDPTLGAPGFARFDFTDNGTPSTSWIAPTGIPPDGAAGVITMKVITGLPSPAGCANLYGMMITDACGDPTTDAGAMNFAGTIAHEVGHMLNLGHRVEDAAIFHGTWDDELAYPPHQNVMHFNEPTSRAQNFDIIQAKIMRGSSLAQ